MSSKKIKKMENRICPTLKLNSRYYRKKFSHLNSKKE